MIWQDFVFLAGSILSIVFLAPTIKDTDARVPLATSLPSMLVGVAYGTAFFTLNMTFSAVGAFATGIMWSLICTFRSPSVTGLLRYDASRDRWLNALPFERLASWTR